MKIRNGLNCLFSLFLFIPLLGSAQLLDPVEWKFSQEHVEGKKFKLIFEAKLDKGWHLYSQHLPPDATPLPTVFNFKDNKAVELLGEVEETGTVTDEDPVSGNELTFFKDMAHFEQMIRLKQGEGAEVAGSVEFMVCDDERCLPPKGEDFSFSLQLTEQGQDGQEETQVGEEAGEKEEATGMVDPVHWDFQLLKTSPNEFVFQARASIDEGWHLYATDLGGGDGPLPTVFAFKDSTNFSYKKGLAEEEPIEKFDKNFQRDLKYFTESAVFEKKFTAKEGAGSFKGYVEFMACDDERCTMPKQVDFSLSLEKAKEKEPVLIDSGGSDKEGGMTGTTDDGGNPAQAAKKEKKQSLWEIFFLCFAGGFAALLTPCVFPMIPLTVSFFTKQSRSRAKGVSNALIYSLSIILIYTFLGFLIVLMFSPDTLNKASTDPIVNIVFFLIFLIFAISFLGAFEITLPNSWVSRSDSISDKGGIIGIFFMALTLSLVSFSCTGPIIGSLLVEASSKGAVMGPVIGMFGFSLALALPFGLFAAFPGWLNSLPQSGGWMNTVKVTLGFLELALAFKFLSNADLSNRYGFLEREVFLAIWIGVFLVLSLYLLGVFRGPNDPETPKLSVPRILFATLSLIFTLYLIPGLFGAPLKLISGVPPPMNYSEYSNNIFLPDGGGSSGDETGGDGEHCPLGLNCFNDYEKGVAFAKKIDKPIMLDFTGHVCANCRKMEEQVWSDPKVMRQIRDDYVLISLYVDERKDLPEEEQRTEKLNGEDYEIETVGDKWAYFEAKNYGRNTQPLYVLLDSNEELLVQPRGYTPNIQEFADWLKKGTTEFNK